MKTTKVYYRCYASSDNEREILIQYAYQTDKGVSQHMAKTENLKLFLNPKKWIKSERPELSRVAMVECPKSQLAPLFYAFTNF